jgi:hypothetical protein
MKTGETNKVLLRAFLSNTAKFLKAGQEGSLRRYLNGGRIPWS